MHTEQKMGAALSACFPPMRLDLPDKPWMSWENHPKARLYVRPSKFVENLHHAVLVCTEPVLCTHNHASPSINILAYHYTELYAGCRQEARIWSFQ